MEDFNHDGLMDLAFGGNPIRVVLRESECGFAPFSSYQVPTPASIAQTMGNKVAGGGVPLVRAADMNGDGQLDLVATFDVVYLVPQLPGSTGPVEDPVDGDTFLAVLLGNPDGTFQLQDTVVSLGSTTITDLAIGETSGDQRPDVVVAGADGQTKTWENTCQWGHLRPRRRARAGGSRSDLRAGDCRSRPRTGRSRWWSRRGRRRGGCRRPHAGRRAAAGCTR